MKLPALTLARRRAGMAAAAALLGAAAVAAPEPGAPIDATLASALQRQAEARARAAWVAQPLLRVQVTLGRMDPRLQLAPCAHAEPFDPAGAPAWGSTRVGLRCVEGPVAWKVTLPVTVQMFTRALVVPAGLAAGATIAADQLASAEVDAAAQADPVLTEQAQASGRVLARAVGPGEALRRSHLRVRQWFAAGDTVRIVAAGNGWSVSGEGRAIGPGIEGQPVSARTENGRTVTGYATGEGRLEVSL